MKVNISKFIFILLLITGCSNTAKVENFPVDSKKINFERVSGIEVPSSKNTSIWTFGGNSEFSFLVKSDIKSRDLANKLENTLKTNDYNVTDRSSDGTAIIAHRGITMNEWLSIVGVYYKKKNSHYQVYIKIEITQDVTGGLVKNNAKDLARYFCIQNDLCIDESLYKDAMQ